MKLKFKIGIISIIFICLAVVGWQVQVAFLAGPFLPDKVATDETVSELAKDRMSTECQTFFTDSEVDSYTLGQDLVDWAYGGEMDYELGHSFQGNPGENLYILMYNQVKNAPYKDALKNVGDRGGYSTSEMQQILEGNLTPIYDRTNRPLTYKEATHRMAIIREAFEVEKFYTTLERDIEAEVLPTEFFANGITADSGFDLIVDLNIIEKIIFGGDEPVDAEAIEVDVTDLMQTCAMRSLPERTLAEKPTMSFFDKMGSILATAVFAEVSDPDCTERTPLEEALDKYYEVNGIDPEEKESDEEKDKEEADSGEEDKDEEGGEDGEAEKDEITEEEDEETEVEDDEENDDNWPDPSWKPGKTQPKDDLIEDKWVENAMRENNLEEAEEGCTPKDWSSLQACAGVGEDEIIQFCFEINMVTGSGDNPFAQTDNCISCHVKYIIDNLFETLQNDLTPNKVSGNLFEPSDCKKAFGKSSEKGSLNLVLVPVPITSPPLDNLVDDFEFGKEWNKFLEKKGMVGGSDWIQTNLKFEEGGDESESESESESPDMGLQKEISQAQFAESTHLEMQEKISDYLLDQRRETEQFLRRQKQQAQLDQQVDYYQPLRYEMDQMMNFFQSFENTLYGEIKASCTEDLKPYATPCG